LATNSTQKLKQLQVNWQKSITEWSLSGLLSKAAEEALQLKQQPLQLVSLINKWKKADFSHLPKINLVNHIDMGGANAGFAVGTNEIYIDSSWLATASQQQFNDVLTEELGHFLDSRLNKKDTQGDEGRYFSRYLQQKGNLNKSEKEGLRARADHSTVAFKGQAIAIETSTQTTSIKIGDVVFESESILPTITRVGGYDYQENEAPVIVFKDTNASTIYIELKTPIGRNANLVLYSTHWSYGSRQYIFDVDDAAVSTGRFRIDNFLPETNAQLDLVLLEENDDSNPGVVTARNLFHGTTYAIDDATWAGSEITATYDRGYINNGKKYFSGQFNIQQVTFLNSNSPDPYGFNARLTSCLISVDDGITWFDSRGVRPTINFTGDGNHAIKYKIFDVTGREKSYEESIFLDTKSPASIISDLKITGEDSSLARSVNGYSLKGGSKYTISGKLSQPLASLTNSQSPEQLYITYATDIQFTSSTEFTATLTPDWYLSNHSATAYVLDAACNVSAFSSLKFSTSSGHFGSYNNIDFNDDMFIKIPWYTGNDELQGFNGDDYIDGLDGNDKVYGGEGDDDLYGADGKDMLYGEWGNDYLNGGEGSDKLFGGDGDDYLVGDNANDTLEGGAGSDILIGGDGKDILIGGGGDDTYVLDDPFDIIDDQGLATDIDTVIIRYQISSYKLSGGVKNADISGNSGITSLTGSADNNRLIGNNSGDVINGLAGNDILSGGSGNDVLNGGSDIDAVDYSNVDEDIVVSLETNKASGIGIGQDSILGFEVVLSGSGNDQISGGVNSDILNGGGGNDQIAGGAGNDELIGGAGNDILNGGVGFDCAEYGDASSNLTINLGDGKVNGTATGGADVGSDSLISIEQACGGSGNDTIKGRTDTVSQLDGGLGNDILTGYGFNDILNGGDGIDTADYSTAVTALIVDLSKGTATGGSEVGTDSLTYIENIRGGSAADTLTGDSESNVLSGAAGNDALIGGAGNDELIGGAGNDILNGGVGFDCAEYGDASSNLTINLGDGKVNGTATGGADVGSDSLISIEQACGGSGNDTIKGRTDTVSQLDGGLGNDILTGYGFNDILNGGAGLDRTTGGAGADSFVYSAISDALVGGTSTARTFDRITDFAIGIDIIDVPGANRKITSLGAVSGLNDSALAGLLTTTNFAAGEAALFTFGTGKSIRTFIGINDGTSGFDASKDAVIEITGYAGSLSNLAIA